MFCPGCGAEEGAFVHGFCVACYLKKHAPLRAPRQLVLERCVRCGRFRAGRRWLQENHDALARFLASKVRVRALAGPVFEVEVSPLENGQARATVRVEGALEGQRVRLEAVIALETRAAACPACSRRAAGYYEAVLQLRFEGAGPEPERVLQAARAFLSRQAARDPLACVVRHKRVKNGFNLRVGSGAAARRLARYLAKRFQGRVLSSHRLVGVDRAGRRLARATYCLRL